MKISEMREKQAKILEFRQQYEKSVSSLKSELEAKRLSELSPPLARTCSLFLFFIDLLTNPRRESIC